MHNSLGEHVRLTCKRNKVDNNEKKCLSRKRQRIWGHAPPAINLTYNTRSFITSKSRIRVWLSEGAAWPYFAPMMQALFWSPHVVSM